MLKMTIDNEEVVSKNDFTIKEEMLSASSTILNNTYPKSWEDDKDYTSRFYYPKDYAKLNIQNFSIEPEEAGTTIDINGSATLTDVDTTKESRVLKLLGQTSQTGTPTPDAPIPVNVVSGDNEINICGKNLFHISSVIVPNDTTTYEKFNDNKISITTSASQAYRYIEIPLNVLSNVNYYFKATFTNSNTSLTALWFAVVDATKSNVLTNASYTSGTQRSFNTGSNKLIYLRLYVTGNVAGLNTALWENIQLTQENTASYEPYIGNTYPIYLGVENLANYQDIPNAPQWGSYGFSKYIELNVKPNTQYIMSSNVPYNQTGQLYFNGGSAPNRVYINNPVVQTSDSNGKIFFAAFSNRDYYNDIINGTYYIQIEEGTKTNHYTPYGTTPIELCKIGTYQDKIYKGEGYNLFDGIFRQGSESNPTTSAYCFSNNDLVLESGTYTFSSTLASGYRFAIFGNESAFPSQTENIYNSGWKTGDLTFTISQTLHIGILVNKNGTSFTPSDLSGFTFQIVKGNQVLPYEPYNAKDKWLVHKEIGKVVLNGSETGWGNLDANHRSNITYTNLGITPKAYSSDCLSNYFIYANTEQYIGFNLGGSALYLRIDNSFTNITQFKNWLSTYKPIFYLLLATPTTTEITDTTLLEQLDALESQ